MRGQVPKLQQPRQYIGSLPTWRKINCTNIEQLLRDVADYRQRYPDYPEGNGHTSKALSRFGQRLFNDDVKFR